MSNNTNYIPETEKVQQNKKYYSYIYEIKHIPTGKLYVGSRCAQSALKKFEDCYTDKYLGSSSYKEGPFSKSDIKTNPQDYQKTILKVFYSEDVQAAYRQEHGENGLIATYWQQYGKDICLNKHYFKKCGEKVWNSAGFYTLANKTEEEKKEIGHKISKAKKGKDPFANKSETELIEISLKKSKSLKGKNKGKDPFANKTEEEKKEICYKISQTLKGRKRENPFINKSEEEMFQYKNKMSEIWKNKTEKEKQEVIDKCKESGKIASNKKYKCPYDDYINVVGRIGFYIKKYYPNEKQWGDYTKEEKEQFKI